MPRSRESILLNFKLKNKASRANLNNNNNNNNNNKILIKRYLHKNDQ